MGGGAYKRQFTVCGQYIYIDGMFGVGVGRLLWSFKIRRLCVEKRRSLATLSRLNNSIIQSFKLQ